jgi:transcription elongation factor Elf1
MFYIDVKYAGLISYKLRNFKQKSTHYWGFSCPLCGDSKKDPLKARGNLKEYKNRLVYKCFNCGVSMSFGNLLKHVDPIMFDEYVLENYKESSSIKTPHANVKDVVKEVFKPKIELTDAALDKLNRCDTLPITHQSVKYLISRKIPKDKWKLFWHTDKFKKFTNSLKKQFDDIKNDHPRLIIPYFTPAGKMFAFQGRAYGNEQPKYFTIKLDENEEKIYGLDMVDYSKRIYVVEGPIDSMFLDNGLAVSGSSFDVPTIRSLASNATLVMDNEPRNKEIMKQLSGYIDKGYSVVIWPDNVVEKDINEMIVGGKNKDEIMDLINTNTYSGLSAKLRYNDWKKV